MDHRNGNRIPLSIGVYAAGNLALAGPFRDDRAASRCPGEISKHGTARWFGGVNNRLTVALVQR